MKENFKIHKFCIHANHDEIKSNLIFIKKFVSQMNWLIIDARYGLNSNDIEDLRKKLPKSHFKVSFVA